MLDLAIPDDDSPEKAASDPNWGAVIPSEVLLEGLRSFQIQKLEDPDQDRLIGDGETLDDLMPSGIRLDLELIEGIWPPVIVAFDASGVME